MAFRAKALTVIFIGMTVAGCSANSHTHAAGSGGSHHTSNSLPVSSRLPNIGDSSNSLTLPLTPYYASTQELAQDQNAQNALLSRCAQRAGFNYPVIVNQPETYGGDPGNGLFYDFGVVSLKFAETYGYHDTTTSVRHHTTSGAPIPSFGSLPVAEQRVLQQCLAQMTRQTRADDNWSVLVQNLALEAWDASKADPGVVADFKRWSACMSAHGFDYATPLQALAGEPGGSARAIQWQTASPSQLEITTATTDVKCKEKTGLIVGWIKALVGYQDRLLEKNLPRLRANLAQFDRQVKAEGKLVGQPS